MQPEPKEFTLTELLACVAREVAMRKSCYVKWDKVSSADMLSPGRKKELALMEAVGAYLHQQAAAPAPADDALLRAIRGRVIDYEADNGPGDVEEARQDYLTDVRALLARLRAAEVPDWITVSEKLPANWQDSRSRDVLVYDPLGDPVVLVGYYCYEQKAWFTSPFGTYSFPTHWQPLPAAPNAGKEPSGE